MSIKNPLTIAIVLQVIGSVVLIAEFMLPTAGILAILATGLFGWSLVSVFTGVSVKTGIFFVVADLFLIPLIVLWGIRMIGRSPAALQSTLGGKEGVNSQDISLNALLNAEGETLSLLRPAGIALIQGKRIDVVAQGAFIEKGSKIIVVRVEGNAVIVRKYTD